MSSEGQQAQTRAEHHAHSRPTEVRQARARVQRALETQAIGRENAITGKDLARGIKPKYTTVRDIISELRDDPYGPPIGQCSDGYFIIQSREELREWIGGVRDELATKRERLEANVASYNRRQKK